jgi:hypothetical protein
MGTAFEDFLHLLGREAVPFDMFRVSIVPVEAGDGHTNSLQQGTEPGSLLPRLLT